ncbi:MAG: putative endonuclease [Thermoanaerobaculia bacterium]|jgi:putative endonuclease|nr:putative endonuclease [Thermoanaerobaculia bacterium]
MIHNTLTRQTSAEEDVEGPPDSLQVCNLQEAASCPAALYARWKNAGPISSEWKIFSRCSGVFDEADSTEGCFLPRRNINTPSTLTNRWHNALYIGITNSLAKRVWQHKAKAISGFTKKYNCDQLVYFEIYERIEQAIAREKQLKGWVRAKKDALVARMNRDWRDLALEWEVFSEKSLRT